MKEDILKEVIDFYGKYTRDPLYENTEINNDLELIGDDADCMLLDFMDRFNINFEGVDLSAYFLPELLLKYWYYKWLKPEKLKKKPLTIGHMAEVVEKGSWFDPVNENMDN